MIGKTIFHYKILEKLGGGGMGVVYKAEDTKLKRLVALKFLPPDLTRDEEAKERFIHEAQAASALDHPNICNIHEIGETEDGQLFIVMAYYDGETLKKKVANSKALARGQLSVDSVIDIAIQVAQGLAKAHEHGITHRDIKPANIMVTNDGVAKIVDFGLAKLAGQAQLTKIGTTLGTAAYMSPEQARCEDVDHRADIWALGVVLYEMLTGQLPFKGEYEQAVVYSILNEEPEPLIPTASAWQAPSVVKRDGFARKAEAALPKAEELAPDLPEVHLAKGMYLYYIKNDLDAALKEIEIAGAKKSNDRSILYQMSLLLSRKGDLEGSLSMAEKICLVDPKGSGGPYLAAGMAFYLGRYKESERWYDVGLANNPESGEGYARRIRTVLMGLGQIDRAEVIFNEASKLVTRDRYYLTICEYFLYLYKRDYSRTLMPLASWEYRERYLLRAAVLRLMKKREGAKANFDSARIAYSEVLSRQPENKVARLSLATAYAGLGEKTKALQEIAQTDFNSINNTDGFKQGLDIAYFYLLLDDSESAIRLLETCIADPLQPTATMLRLDPRLDPLRGDPRFDKVIEKAGNRYNRK